MRYVTLYICIETQLIIFKGSWKVNFPQYNFESFPVEFRCFLYFIKTYAINVFVVDENLNFPFNKKSHVKKILPVEQNLEKTYFDLSTGNVQAQIWKIQMKCAFHKSKKELFMMDRH